MGNNKRILLKRGVLILLSLLFATFVFASPLLNWEPIETTNNDYLFLNATIEGGEVMSFFDWNNSLLGYWNFETTNETGAFDNSSYNTFGNFKSGAVISGKFGHAFQANSTEYFDTNMNYSLSGGEPISVFAWVKDISSGNAYVVAQSDLVSYSSDWILGFGNGGLWCDGQIVDGNNIISDGSWHLLGFTSRLPTNSTKYNSTLYIDGELIGFCDGPDSNSPGINSVKVMARGDGAPGASGIIDELIIFNRELNIPEIQSLYGVKNIFNNFTNLNLGNYSYSLYSIDALGNLNKSEHLLSVEAPVLPEAPVSVGDYVLYYSFDEGNATDDSCNGHDGLLKGDAVAVENGKIGGAISFDGYRDYVYFSDPLGQTPSEQEWTVSAWVNLVSNEENGWYQNLIYGWNKGLELVHGTQNKLLLWANNKYYSYTDQGILVDQGWKHVTFVFRNEDQLIKIYVDGVNVTKGELKVDFIPSGFLDPLRLGYSSNGLIDEVKIWDRVLTDEEIASVYSGILINPEPDTVYPLFSYDDESFSVIIENTNGTVFLELNNTNITAERDENIFSVVNNLILPDSYSYRWWAYGNGESNNLGSNELKTFVIEEESSVEQPVVINSGRSGGKKYECRQNSECEENYACENYRCIKNYEIEDPVFKADGTSEDIQVDKEKQLSNSIIIKKMPEDKKSIGFFTYGVMGIFTMGFLFFSMYTKFGKVNHRPRKGLRKIFKKHF